VGGMERLPSSGFPRVSTTPACSVC